MKKNSKWYKKLSNLLTIIICVLLIPILVINCSIIFQANTDKDKVPSVFGYKPFIVLSGSMENTIKKGDLIIVEVVNAKNLTKGKVIAFRDAEGTVTTHRIIEIVEDETGKYYVTKGDNNNSQDQNLVEPNDVEGIYKGRIPGVGNILNALAQPTTIVILVLGITLIFGLGFYVSTKKQRDKEHQEFLEYKKQKEMENKSKEPSKKTTAKKSSKKTSQKD